MERQGTRFRFVSVAKFGVRSIHLPLPQNIYRSRSYPKKTWNPFSRTAFMSGQKQKWFSRSDSTPNDFRRIPWGVPQLVGIPNSHQSTMMQFNTWTTQPSQLSNKNHSSSTKKSHAGPQSPPLLLELRDFEFVAKVIITHHAQGISKMTQPLGGMSV